MGKRGLAEQLLKRVKDPDICELSNNSLTFYSRLKLCPFSMLLKLFDIIIIIIIIIIIVIGELKQQRRRQLRKRHLKSELALPQTLSRLFRLV